MSFESFWIHCFLSFAVLITFAAADSTPLFHSCSNSASNNQYDAALHDLLHHFRDRTHQTERFTLGSLGGSPQNRPYGVAQCRGDVSASDCQSCAANATVEILRRCPNDKSAAIWYDNCFVKYSDSDFFGQVDDTRRVRFFYLVNTANATDATSFDGKARELLGQLAQEAAYVAPRMFATGDIGNEVYGMVECSRDLTRSECRKCVGEAIDQIPMCCGGKVGGHVIAGSCRVRYETYPFVNRLRS